jgi:hypothetical protein
MDARTDRRPDEPPYRVSLGDPGEIAAGLPHLLGFRPQESVVLVSLTGARGVRVGLTVRADIPLPEHAATLADYVTGSVRRDRPTAVLLLVVSEAAPEEDLPHRDLVHAVTVALFRDRIPVRDALLVGNGRWWSYDCPSGCCRPWAGTPLPTGTSPLAAATVAAGVVVADSREALAARIAPIDGPRRSAMASAARRAAADAGARSRAGGAAAVAEESWAAVEAGVAHARAGVALSDAALARLLWGLRNVGVRDRALRLALDDDDAAVESLWTTCVRRAPRKYLAAPATLLAVSAWLRGDGAMAGLALERALAADRTYRLAGLLSEALTGCLPPGQLREVIARGAATDTFSGA